MHSFLPAIGFSKITKEELDELLYEAIRRPDGHKVGFDSEGNEYVELTLQVCKDVGIAIRGVYDMDDSFKIDYYYPYCCGEAFSSNADLEIIKQSDKESYQVLCDEMRLGVNMIFFLQNMIEYLQKGQGRTFFSNESYRQTSMTGLSLDGMILLPIAKTPVLKTNQKNTDRTSLVAAARGGDEDAIESLTLDDMDTYSMLSKRVEKEDIYSIVSTTFMPYGIENDKYMVIGEIIDIQKMVNQISLEELYLMRLQSNDIEFDVCINKKDLLGEPAIGRRFKGNIWMQGMVEF